MKKFLISTILGLIIIASGITYYINNDNSSFSCLNSNKGKINDKLVPKIDEIKETKHLKHITEYLLNSSSKENQNIKLKEYLDSLDLKNLLLVSSEIAYEYDYSSEALMMVVPYGNKIITELDVETYNYIILNKEYAYKRINKILDDPKQFSEFEVNTARSLGHGDDI